MHSNRNRQMNCRWATQIHDGCISRTAFVRFAHARTHTRTMPKVDPSTINISIFDKCELLPVARFRYSDQLCWYIPSLENILAFRFADARLRSFRNANKPLKHTLEIIEFHSETSPEEHIVQHSRTRTHARIQTPKTFNGLSCLYCSIYELPHRARANVLWVCECVGVCVCVCWQIPQYLKTCL